jgi:DHA1 family multidrug resistance protein-like MFS transporter
MSIAVPNLACWKKRPVQNLLLIALFAEIGYATMNISTMPIYLVADRKFGQSVIGLVMVSFLLFEAVFKSVMGHVADRFGTRKLLIAGPSISIATSIISIFLPHGNGSAIEVFAFVVLRAFDGLAVAMLWPAAFSQMNSVVEDGERQQAMSYLNACYMIGIALAFPMGGIANDIFKVKWAGLVLATILFVGAALGAYFTPSSNAPIVADEEHSGGGLKAFLDSIKQIPEYLLLATVAFMGIGFPLAIFKLFTLEEFRMSESAVGGMIFPGAIAMAALSGPLAKFGDRIGRARAVHFGLMLCTIGLSLIAIGGFLPFLRSPYLFGLAGLPAGLGFLLTIPAWMASVSDLNPERRATNIGAIMTAQGVGAMIGAPIGSAMYEKLQPLGKSLHLGESFGRYSPFMGCAVCVGVAWALSLKILHPLKEDAPKVDSAVVETPSEVCDPRYDEVSSH